MKEITVTSEKVNVNGRDGYIATATDGTAYTRTHLQDNAEDAENVAVRLFKDGIIDGYIYHDDMRSENTDDGKTMEAPRQVIQYHGKAGHFWAGFRFYGLVILIGGGALFSFLCLVGSVLIGPR